VSTVGSIAKTRSRLSLSNQEQPACLFIKGSRFDVAKVCFAEVDTSKPGEALVEVVENTHYAPKKVLQKLGFYPM
jgi:hypothetical protein